MVTEGLSPLNVSHPRHRPRGADRRCCATGGAPPACAGCGRCSTTASRCTARSWCARASTTAPCSTTRWPACSTATPSWPRSASCRSASAGSTPSRACGPTPRPRPRPSSTASRTGRTSSCAVLGRRLVFAADEYYLLAERPFPAAEAYEGFPMHEDGVGMARTFELEFARRRPTTPPASQAGFFAWVDARRARPTPTTSRTAGTRATAGPAAAGASVRGAAPGRHPHRRLRRPGARAAASRGSAATTCGWSPVDNQFFGGNTGVTGLLVGEDLARVLADEPEGHRYLLPDVCLSQRPLPRRHHARRPAPPGRGRRHRRPRPARRARAAGPQPAAADDPARRRHRRPPQRRQVDARQPHRRPPRGDRRGEARASPATARRSSRVAGRAVHARRHRRLAARRRRASTTR